MDEAKGNHKTLTGAVVHVTYEETGAGSLVRNTGTKVSPLVDIRDESTPIRDLVLNRKFH